LKRKKSNHQLYLVWCYGVRVYADGEIGRNDATAPYLPPNLRRAVNEEVAKAGNLPEDSPAVFNNPNGELEMPNQHIMALALALCNVSNGKTSNPCHDRKPAHLLMMWLRALQE
jgi:hypothetical protein